MQDRTPRHGAAHGELRRPWPKQRPPFGSCGQERPDGAAHASRDGPSLYSGDVSRFVISKGHGLARRLLLPGVVTDLTSGRHSTAQVVFAVSRTLLLAHLLWGEQGAIALAGLAPAVGVPARCVERAVVYLCSAGLAELDDEHGRIGLTRFGIRELGGASGSGTA